jgi:hypothetical protein
MPNQESIAGGLTWRADRILKPWRPGFGPACSQGQRGDAKQGPATDCPVDRWTWRLLRI